MKTNKFRKFDAGKIPVHMFPAEVGQAVARVFEHGLAKGYYKWNWLDGSTQAEYTRYLDAIQRHKDALSRGEETDPESGLPHSWHLACNTTIVVMVEMTHGFKDDRQKYTVKPELDPANRRTKLWKSKPKSR